MSSSAPSITSSPPLLPPELIDEILRENELSNSDLALCCLVSHQFLPSARQSLYNKLDVLLSYDVDANLELRWCFLHSTRKLWKTLKKDPRLVDLCRGLLLHYSLVSEEIDFTKAAGTPGQVLQEWLELLKSVQNLSAFISGPDSIAFEGRHWDTLRINVDSITGCLPSSVQASGVKRLALNQDCFDDAPNELAIPQSVVTFDYSLMRGWKLLPATNLRLRNLLINVNQANSIEFSRFPNLAHLLISQHGFSEINPNCLSGLTHLRRLSLKIGSHGGLNPSDRLHSPLSNLPSSIYRLDFHDSIPFEILTTILDDDSLSITQLGLSQWVNSDSTQKQKVDDLKELFQRRGIDIYYVGRENPVFVF